MSEALKLFDGERDRKQTFVNDIYLPTAVGFFGFSTMCFVNWATRRPIFSGVQKHVLATGIGAWVGRIFDVKRNEYYAERDAVLRHYIELHPEDFEMPERKKFAQVFDKWCPVR